MCNNLRKTPKINYCVGRNVLLSICLLSFPTTHLLSQPDSAKSLPIKVRKNHITVNIFGPTYFTSLAYGKYLSEKIEGEIGLGLIGYYGGLKYHMIYKKVGKESESISPYAGLYYSHAFFFDTTEVLRLKSTDGLYFPLGVHYQGQEHFHFAAEIAVVKPLDNYRTLKYGVILWPGIRFGWHF